MHIRRGVLQVTGLCAALALAGLAGCAAGSQAAPPELSPQRIAEIVAAPDRSAADRTADARRKPAQVLAFIGPRPGMVALDVSAAGGYTTELLARAAGAGGTVYGQSRPATTAMPRPAVPEDGSPPIPRQMPQLATPGMPGTEPAPPRPGPRPSPEALAARNQAMRAAHVDAASIIAVVQPFDNPVPPAIASGGADVVTLMLNYHDFGYMGVDRAGMNRAIFQALKPGGVYVIADHAGRPGTGISEAGTLHRVEEAFVVREVEAAGFRFAGRGDFLGNPNDPRDRNQPVPPQPKDDFIVRFVKP